MSDPSFAGYTLAELEKLCMDRAGIRAGTVPDPHGDTIGAYHRAATAALPFLVARMKVLERRHGTRSRHQEGRAHAAR